MKKLFIWLILIIFLSNSVLSETDICLKPDEYVLKCEFDPYLFEKSFTCIDKLCVDKIYTYNNNILLIDLKTKNESIRVLKNQINLNKIQNNLNLIQIICKDEISKTMLDIFDKKITQSKTKGLQSFVGTPLIIQKQNTKIKPILETNCFTSYHDKYLDWLIETRTKSKYCEYSYNNQTACYSESFQVKTYLEDSNQFILIVIFSSLLIVGILIGIIGFLTHLFEHNKINNFLKLTKRKIIISLFLFFPFFYMLGRVIDIILYQIYQDSFLMPILTLLFGLNIVYFLSCLSDLIFQSHKTRSSKINKIHTLKHKTLIRKRKKL